jgi:thiol-disulfide isomerase/thioredoxin
MSPRRARRPCNPPSPRAEAADLALAVHSRTLQVILLSLSWLCFAVGCNVTDHAASGAPPAAAALPSPVAKKPRIVPGQLPVAAFVAEQLERSQGTTTLVYVGASWCEPCQRFHRALEAGELDATLPAWQFIEYDYDTAKLGLDADGYSSKLIPLFVLPNADGRASTHSIQGSIKGPGAIDNIVPRLQQLLKQP